MGILVRDARGRFRPGWMRSFQWRSRLTVHAVPRPRVAILVTGDVLVDGDPPGIRPVRRRGSAMLAGSATADGFALVTPGSGSIPVGGELLVERWVPLDR